MRARNPHAESPRVPGARLIRPGLSYPQGEAERSRRKTGSYSVLAVTRDEERRRIGRPGDGCPGLRR